MATAIEVQAPDVRPVPPRAEDPTRYLPPWPPTPRDTHCVRPKTGPDGPPPRPTTIAPVAVTNSTSLVQATTRPTSAEVAAISSDRGSVGVEPVPGDPHEDPPRSLEPAQPKAPAAAEAPPKLSSLTLDLRPEPATTIRAGLTVEPVQSSVSIARRAALFLVGLAGLFVVSAAITSALWVTVPSLLPGWMSVVITSDSMAPSIRSGDIVVAAPSSGVGLEVGTVVVFEDSARPGLVTHRIVGLNADGTYRTQGDANSQPDSTPLRPDQVIGTGRFLVPLIGLSLAWFSAGAWVKAGLWTVLILAALWTGRLAFVVDPYREPRPGGDDGPS